VKTSVFNCSSFAAQDISEMIRTARKNKWLKSLYEKGQITLEALNESRKQLHLPPLSAWIMKRLKLPVPGAVMAPETESTSTEQATSVLGPRKGTRNRRIRPKNPKPTKLTPDQIFYEKVKRLQEISEIQREINPQGL